MIDSIPCYEMTCDHGDCPATLRAESVDDLTVIAKAARWRINRWGFAENMVDHYCPQHRDEP